MELFNLEPAYIYMDTRTDDLERGAAIGVYGGYQLFADNMAGVDRLASETPLDMLLLLRSAVIAFHDTPVEAYRDSMSPTGLIVNRERAEELLSALPEGKILHRSRRFLDAVLALANDSPCDQDLSFLLEIFLKSITRCTPEAIESGEYAEYLRRLEDPNNW